MLPQDRSLRGPCTARHAGCCAVARAPARRATDPAGVYSGGWASKLLLNQSATWARLADGGSVRQREVDRHCRRGIRGGRASGSDRRRDEWRAHARLSTGRHQLRWRGRPGARVWGHDGVQGGALDRHRRYGPALAQDPLLDQMLLLLLLLLREMLRDGCHQLVLPLLFLLQQLHELLRQSARAAASVAAALPPS